MKRFIDKKIYVYCPDHRIFDYLYHSEFVFKNNELIFVKNLDKYLKFNKLIFIDQLFLKKILEERYNLKSTRIAILLWNADFDYLKYKTEINKIKSRAKKIYLVTQNNYTKNKVCLNNFSIEKNLNLKKIIGLSLIKKIKYFYPLVYSIYNFFINFDIARKIIVKNKIVFVGLAGMKDMEQSFKMISKSIPEKKNKIFLLKILSFIKNKKKNNLAKLLAELLHNDDFANLKFHIKYYIINVLIRFFFISHLKKFDCFYLKNNKKNTFDLLYSNIYKKVIQLDIGSKVGNSEIYTRRLLIEKFYKKSFLKIYFFDNKVNYFYNKKFIDRLTKISEFLIDVEKINTFKMKSSELLEQLTYLNNKHFKTISL